MPKSKSKEHLLEKLNEIYAKNEFSKKDRKVSKNITRLLQHNIEVDEEYIETITK